MNRQEHDAWLAMMRKNSGHWMIDPCHNGQNGKRILMYCTDGDDVTSGQFIEIIGGHATAGKFSDAYGGVVTDGFFEILWEHDFSDFSDALARVIEKTGMSMLMTVIFGKSPYRTA